MISFYTLGSTLLYVGWRLLNIHRKYQYEKKLSYGNVWDIFFTLLMCYWLLIPTVLFLIAKLIDGIFALCLGVYINILPVADSQINHRDKIINGYWKYTITDLGICVVCFLIAILGAANV